jgi:hypothetical protein
VRLYCIFGTSILLWSLTAPIDPRLVPAAKSMELRVEVCAVTDRVMQVETAYVLDERVIGEIKVEKICVKDGKRGGQYECVVDPPVTSGASQGPR